MSFCQLNISIGVFESSQGGIFLKVNKNGKRIENLFGQFLDKLLAGTREVRRCKFVPVDQVGTKLKNGTLTGAKRLLQEKKIDFYSRFESLLIVEEDFIDVSGTATSERTVLGQFAHIPKPQNVDSLAFLKHSRAIVLILLVGFFLTSLNVLLFRMTNLRSLSVAQSLQRLRSRMVNFFMNYEQRSQLLTKLNVIMVAFLLFQSVCLSMLSSNLKTNDIVVDVSGFIDSKSRLWSTAKWPCWMGEESNFNYFRNSRQGSDLRRIFEKRKPDGSLCFVDHLDDLDRLAKFDLNQAFFTMDELSVFYLITMFSRFAKNMIVFEAQTILDNEQIMSSYVLASLEPHLKRRLLFKINRYFESGFYLLLFDEFERATMHFVKNDLAVFSNVQDLKDAFVKIQVIDLPYFESLFISLAGFYFLLFGLFFLWVPLKLWLKLSLKLLFKYTIRKLKSIKSRLQRYHFDRRLQFRIRCPACKIIEK